MADNTSGMRTPFSLNTAMSQPSSCDNANHVTKIETEPLSTQASYDYALKSPTSAGINSPRAQSPTHQLSSITNAQLVTEQEGTHQLALHTQRPVRRKLYVFGGLVGTAVVLMGVGAIVGFSYLKNGSNSDQPQALMGPVERKSHVHKIYVYVSTYVCVYVGGRACCMRMRECEHACVRVCVCVCVCKCLCVCVSLYLCMCTCVYKC